MDENLRRVRVPPIGSTGAHKSTREHERDRAEFERRNSDEYRRFHAVLVEYFGVDEVAAEVIERLREEGLIVPSPPPSD